MRQILQRDRLHRTKTMRSFPFLYLTENFKERRGSREYSQSLPRGCQPDQEWYIFCRRGAKFIRIWSRDVDWVQIGSIKQRNDNKVGLK